MSVHTFCHLRASVFAVDRASIESSTAPRRDLAGRPKRIAVPITPVSPNDDELYHILRKRLLGQVARSL
jgi:hypothetical protein